MFRAVENAIRGCGPCRPEPEPAGGGVEDVLMEVKDLSTGVYGEPYKVVRQFANFDVFDNSLQGERLPA